MNIYPHLAVMVLYEFNCILSDNSAIVWVILTFLITFTATNWERTKWINILLLEKEDKIAFSILGKIYLNWVFLL